VRDIPWRRRLPKKTNPKITKRTKPQEKSHDRKLNNKSTSQ
jgi:hypothetical protein